MAHIRKHPVTSRPQVRWRDPSGRERSKTFARATDARAYMAMVNHEASLGELWDRSLQKTPFAEVAAAWLKGKVGLRRSSWVRDESYLRRHVLPYFGGREVGSITRQEASDWVRGLCEAPASERWPASPAEGGSDVPSAEPAGASDRGGERQRGEGLWGPAGDGAPAEAPPASEASGRRGERPKGANPSGPGASPSAPSSSSSSSGLSGGLSPATARQCFRIFASVMEEAIERGLIRSSPV